MARKKLLRLQEIDSLSNTFRFEDQNTEEKITEFFPDTDSLTLEIGCGHGDYSINLAQKYPLRRFIGMDVKATRIWVGAKKALTENALNVAFIIGRAEKLPEIFPNLRFDEIWVPFPDSLPRRRDYFKRLYSENFINIYKKILAKEGVVHFKTDDLPLFEFAKANLNRPDIKILKCIEDLHNSEETSFEEEIKTTYEKVHIKNGRTIKYIKFTIS